jgi:quercetin dioxygenase-like cupin family protein
MSTDIDISRAGWDINRFDDTEWIPWGSRNDARAKILGQGDGYMVVLVEAQAGYRGDPHTHEFAEFSYVIDGAVRNQGEELGPGDGYAAAAGSTHTDFEATTAARYLVIFRI